VCVSGVCMCELAYASVVCAIFFIDIALHELLSTPTSPSFFLLLFLHPSLSNTKHARARQQDISKHSESVVHACEKISGGVWGLQSRRVSRGAATNQVMLSNELCARVNEFAQLK
jgi:hypothetical protein